MQIVDWIRSAVVTNLAAASGLGMAMGKAAALTAALFGAVMYGAGVRTGQTVNRASEISAPAHDSISRPELIKQLRPLLNEGVDTSSLAAGFESAEDFAATVHAARNIRVPFVALKHEVVDEGRSLGQAIQLLKPAADASLEADLARSEARSDVAALK
jgi:hypothetical protein